MTTIFVTRYTLAPKCPWMGWLPQWQWLMKLTHEEIETEIEVVVEGRFYKGEPMSLDSPEEPGYVEFEVAYLNGKPFLLEVEEMERAEDALLEVIQNKTPEKWRRRWAI